MKQILTTYLRARCLPQRLAALAVTALIGAAIVRAPAPAVRVDLDAASYPAVLAGALVPVLVGALAVAPAPVRLGWLTAWLTMTAWQGGDLQVDHLVPLGDGSYRTTKLMPLTGEWKTLVRLQDGRTLTAVPVYLPADAAINKPEVPALASFTRPAVDEKTIMQRELKQDVPSWLWNTAMTVVLVCAVLLVTALGWGVSRVSRAANRTGGSPPTVAPPPDRVRATT